MPLQPQPLPIQFAGGVETKQDAKQIPITKLIDLQNCTFIKQTTLAKRNGYRALGGAIEGSLAAFVNPKGLATRDTELVRFGNGHAYSYLDTTDRWSDCGPVDSVVVADVPIARTGTQQSMPDVAANRGISVAAWEDSIGGVWFSVLNTASQRVIVAPRQLDASGQRPRCVACGGNVLVLYAVPSNNRIWCAVVNPVTPTVVPVPVILTEDLSATNPVYDADPTTFNADSPAIMTWAQAGGGHRVGYLHPSGVLGAPVVGLPTIVTYAETPTGPLAISWDQIGAARAAVVWADSALKARMLQTSDLSSLATGTLSAGPSTWLRCSSAFAYDLPNGAALAIWWAGEVSGGSDDTNLVQYGAASSALATSSTATLRGHGIVAHAFCDGGIAYLPVVHAVPFFSYVAVIRMSAELAAPLTFASARLVPGQSPGLPTRTHVAQVQRVTSRKHALPVLYRIQLAGTAGGFGEVGIRFATLDFDSAAAWQTAKLGRGLYLASACMQHYDGKRWAEADFHTAPEPIALGLYSEIGGIGVGTYGYKILYEEIDAQGELHRGAVSVPFIVVVAAPATVTLVIPTYRLTAKTRVRIGVFRSPANQTGDPDAIPYYRVSSVDPTVAGTNGYKLNDPTADTISFTDAMTDAVLLTKEPLYTNGGILSNDPPTFGGGAIAGGKSRLFWTDSADPNLVRYSQELADETSVETVQRLSLRCDPYGGGIVAIGLVDSTVVVFKETAIYAFTGPGPNANPNIGQEAWTPPQLLTSDVGCQSPRSLVQTPIGIAFQSQKGIKLLGRDMQVSDIGASVYAYNSQTIVRATLLPDRHQIVFLTSAGRTLLYDYEHEQWSTYTNHEGLDAVVVNGVYNYLRADGRVFVETPGIYRDDNSHIPMRIETAWVKMTGYLQGWQSVLWAFFLGTYVSEHTLRMRYRIDYQEAYSAPIDMNVNSNYNPSLYGAGKYGAGSYGGAGGDSTVYQRRVHLNRKCQSVSFRIEDVEATDSYGAAFQLSELLLIGGVLAPDFKVGAARSQ